MKGRTKACRERLHRLRQLRGYSAPAWIIKSEQVALVLEREGLRYVGIGRTGNRRQIDLFARHVLPRIE